MQKMCTFWYFCMYRLGGVIVLFGLYQCKPLLIKFYTKMMMNTVCNSNLLFIKYIYYTVQVEFCYNVAHMCRASCSLVELCSLQCVLSK